MAHAQADWARGARHVGVFFGDRATHHVMNESPFVQLTRRSGGDHAPVAQDGHRVADLEYLAEPVGDVDDRLSLIAQMTNRLEEDVGFDLGQGACRFVHYDEPRVQGERSGDLHHLLLTDAQPSDEHGGIEGLTHRRQILSRLRHESRPINQAEPIERLSAQEEILADGEAGQEVQFLVDHGYPSVDGLPRAGEMNFVAIEPDGSTGVGIVDAGDDSHERGLARAIFADKPHDLAGPNGEIDVGQHMNATEGLADAAQFEDRRRCLRSVGRRMVRLGHGAFLSSHPSDELFPGPSAAMHMFSDMASGREPAPPSESTHGQAPALSRHPPNGRRFK